MFALGLLLLRVIVGLTLAAHGAQKLFGWFGGSGIGGWTGMVESMRIRPARPWAYIAALSELAGGLLLALGFLSPIGSFAIAGSMLVAIAIVHWPKGFFATKGGYEFNLVILAAVAALALTGPGPYSLDAALGIHIPQAAALVVLTVVTLAGVGATLASRRPAAKAAKPQTA